MQISSSARAKQTASTWLQYKHSFWQTPRAQGSCRTCNIAATQYIPQHHSPLNPRSNTHARSAPRSNQHTCVHLDLVTQAKTPSCTTSATVCITAQNRTIRITGWPFNTSCGANQQLPTQQDHNCSTGMYQSQQAEPCCSHQGTLQDCISKCQAYQPYIITVLQLQRLKGRVHCQTAASSFLHPCLCDCHQTAHCQTPQSPDPCSCSCCSSYCCV